MRVYDRGKIVPMGQVTLEILSKPTTLITPEDPDVAIPANWEFWHKELRARLATSLRADSNDTQRYNSAHPPFTWRSFFSILFAIVAGVIACILSIMIVRYAYQ